MSANTTTATAIGRRNKVAAASRRSSAEIQSRDGSATLGHEPINTPTLDSLAGGGGLPNGWHHVKLGQIAEIVMGQAPPGATTNFEQRGTIFVKAGEFGPIRPVVREWTTRPLKFAKAGDVLICVVGATCGKLNLAVDCAIGRSVAALRPNERTFDRFLHFQLMPKVLGLRAGSTGSAQGVLSRDVLAGIDLVLPPLSEQRRIVAEIEKQFTRLEAGVAALRRVQANLKRYRAAVLKAACEGKLVRRQAEWPTTTIGAVCRVLAGYGFPERLQGRTSGDIGFYKVGDISEVWKRGQKVLTQAKHYISKADLAELRAKLLPAGTIVFAKIGAAIALNRRAIVGEPSLVDNNVMGLLGGERINPRFLFHFTCTLKLDDLARATTVPSIRKGDVEGIELQLPPLAEQTRIVAEVERRLSVVEELESVVSANLQRVVRLQQSILQKAFTGELV